MVCPGSKPGTVGQVGAQDEELEEAEQPQQFQTPQAPSLHTCTRWAQEKQVLLFVWAPTLGMR